MTNEQLVKKVARAMYRAEWEGEVPQEGEEVFFSSYASISRAAIAVVVEECARVADEWGVTVYGDDDKFTREHAEEIANTVAPNIAAAIRKLGEMK